MLVQPGTFSNVENGFGFVGSVGRFSVEWLVADTTARTLRYTPLRSALGKEASAVLTRLKQDIGTVGRVDVWTAGRKEE